MQAVLALVQDKSGPILVTPLDTLTRPASEGDVLDVPAVAARLGLPVEEARGWLEDSGLIRRIAGRERVVWGQVLDTLRHPRVQERPWSESDVLTVAKAVRRLAMNEQAGRAWLTSNGLVRPIGKTKRVIWGDVLRALQEELGPTTTPPRPCLSRPLPRSRLLMPTLGR